MRAQVPVKFHSAVSCTSKREDFMEVPAKKWFRLAPGQMVRLKSAYIIKCDEVIKDDKGNITELRCSYIPEKAEVAMTRRVFM